MVRKQYSKSEIKKLLEEYPFVKKFVTKKSQVVEEDDFLRINGESLFFFKEEKLIPTLHSLLKEINLLPYVVVDKGAIKFVANGADIMRPGIVGCDSFDKGAFVVIIEETYKKPLAVGIADYNSIEILEMKEGKVISTIHFIGDSIWEKSQKSK